MPKTILHMQYYTYLYNTYNALTDVIPSTHVRSLYGLKKKILSYTYGYLVKYDDSPI